MAEITRFDVLIILNGNKNFAGVDLSGLELGGLDFAGANLRGATISGADLRGINFAYADLTAANLSYSDLSDANLDHANLDYTLLRGTRLTNAEFGTLELDDTFEFDLDLEWLDFDDDPTTETFNDAYFFMETSDFRIDAVA